MNITYQTYEYGSHGKKSKPASMNERQLDLTQQIIYILVTPYDFPTAPHNLNLQMMITT